MSFNTAISGIHAANKRLEVAGNNIANVGTLGFKSSRAQFSALYSSAQLGNGNNAVGDGVRLAAVQQNFNQGETVISSGNALDMRIQGNGFFVVSDQGSLAYTRAGAFLKDAANFVVDSDGGRLQGYAANDKGEIISGIRTDLQIDTSNVAARATTRVSENINLDSSLPSLSRLPVFDPANPATYTRVAGRTIQDVGIVPVQAADHELKQYFVKTEDNQWTMHVLVDGRNPLDPDSVTPLQVRVELKPDGSLSYSDNNQHIRKISDTEFALQDWVPARQVNGVWMASGSLNGGTVSLPLEEAGVSVLDPTDSVMSRSVPDFDASDLNTYSRMFGNQIFDSQGNMHELKQYFVKDGTNSWRMHVLIDDRNPQQPESKAPLTANIVFDTHGSVVSLTGSTGLDSSKGNLLQLTGWSPAMVASPGTEREHWAPNGAAGSANGMTIDFTNLLQHNAASSRSSAYVDGHSAGELKSLDVGRDGILRAGFTNGMNKDIGQVMLASFANPHGLQPRSDTRWAATADSGVADYDVPGIGTLGSIISGGLEGSNVVLADELIALIQAQTAYQANSKAISTEVTLMQTLIQST
ncbi:Flagellar hook protein FlgE [Pseudomonas coronafaciens pv. garcae]|uniref:Flagellar hook protein FlgE n=2 Tax=Pseudomonas syringae group TaxID=136849 RepID=A0AB37QMJ5_9PSED|nr:MULTISPECIES: flagellar hook-basal body complex protein [Pseudomonas syringae group]KPB56009.1 Flagellar hook protein FlgE [Pseudomonas coronafaciens pv. oryzae]KPY06885.1 Flagellar hook protein FlgE [Pseudomonas coronafaciens pv. oryzae]RMR99291.1 Flagellar hook protein FlgE [Pseudomonas coronafaciens pv. garcae]RMS02393.1 Flagellar hook protein FlgE [Pseudomonas coronafaciens pv. garcae]RMT08476.1 Flagellar hook protein FlgE [Pseudomonas coronafaciens pv. oryzae]